MSAATVWLRERSETSEGMADRVGMTVHEVKNLLALIQMSAWLMMRDSDQEEEARERFEVVRESCLRAERFLDRCLLGVGGGVVLPTPQAWVNLAEVVQQEVHLRCAALPEDRRGSLAVALKLEPVHVWGDPEALRTAVGNLVGNALKFTSETLEIRLYQRQSEVRLLVLDDGPGVNAALRKRIFRRYQQGPGPASGMGLGLWIVRKVARSHGGRAGCRNRRRGGACFWLRLPAWPGNRGVSGTASGGR